MKKMTRDEMDAWLGGDWTDEQRDKIAEDFSAWEDDNPDADQDEGAIMLTAIAQHHDGELVILDLGRVRREVKAAVIVSVTIGGMAEAEAARAAGIDRMTVRKWLGKR